MPVKYFCKFERAMNEGGFGFEAALYDEIIAGKSNFMHYSFLDDSKYWHNQMKLLCSRNW